MLFELMNQVYMFNKYCKGFLIVKCNRVWFRIDCSCSTWLLEGANNQILQWIELFALRIAVSYSLLYPVREIWFVSTCHLRQGNSCVRAPLRPRFALHFSVLSIGVDTTLSESRVVYRQCLDHVGCFCCRAIVKLFLLLLIKSLL